MNNTPHYQEMFRKRVVSYSAVSHGKIQQGIPFIQPTSSDTMRITMQTEHSVYPVGTETISVELANGNSKDLFFGERYNVVRKEGNRWILLHDGGAWNDIGYGLGQGDAHLFTARLRPIVNDNKPGTYKVVKEIGFKGSSQNGIWAQNLELNKNNNMKPSLFFILFLLCFYPSVTLKGQNNKADSVFYVRIWKRI